MMATTTDGRKDDGNNTNRETAALAGSTTPTPPSSSSKKKKKNNLDDDGALENHVALLTKERDEARRFGETTLALFKKEKLALKNEAKETQVNALNEKRMWEQERKGLKEDGQVESLSREDEKEREREREREKKVATNGDKNDEISLTEFLDMEAALEKEREWSGVFRERLRRKAKEYAAKNEQTKIEISKMTAERETLKANAKNMYKKLNEWDQMQSRKSKSARSVAQERSRGTQAALPKRARERKRSTNSTCNTKRIKRNNSTNDTKERRTNSRRGNTSKYRREVERAVSDARMKAEEEFNEKIERHERDTRSKNAKFEKKFVCWKSSARKWSRRA